MINVVIGNTVALIASLLMVYSGFLKKKNKILYVQTVQILLFIVSNLVLGGITGAIINAISCIRNILCYKDRLRAKEKVVIALLSIILSLKFNNLGLIGLLPLLSTLCYILVMNTKDVIKFKILIIATACMWLIYDIYIKSYTSAIFDFASMAANFITILQITRNNR